MRALVWFRQDLRIQDQPALSYACEKANQVLGIYCLSPEEEGDWPMGAASRWWLHFSLLSLQQSLSQLGIPLLFLKGKSLDLLPRFVKEAKIDLVCWNRCYEPAAIARDTAMKAVLQKPGCTVQSFKGSLLFEPWEILSQKNEPFRVFTPFWKSCLKQQARIGSCLAAPAPKEPFPDSIPSLSLSALDLLPKIPWDTGLRSHWKPGEKGAQERAQLSLDTIIPFYKERRDRPDVAGVSELSPHLHFGEVSPRQLFQQAHPVSEEFTRQLFWREFAHHLLYHFPKTPKEPLRPEFQRFPWEGHPKHLQAWQEGKTGYPFVDAAMRQLWQLGWMHNRCRMVVASFLVKDLRIHWLEGARWFWDTLVDADLANNTFGWQWTAGCGADAAPYFRIFHPTLQGEKFDSTREFVRFFVPELRHLPDQWIYRPHEAPEEVLRASGIVLGETYPHPLVDHDAARKKALEAFAAVKMEGL